MSKSMHNWRRCPSPNWCKIDQKMQFWIWRSAVAPSDATEKNRTIGAQLQSLLYTTAKKYFGKFTSYMTWCAQTCSFRAIFWTPCAKFDNAPSPHRFMCRIWSLLVKRRKYTCIAYNCPAVVEIPLKNSWIRIVIRISSSAQAPKAKVIC